MPIDLKSIGQGAQKFLAQMLPYITQQKFQKEMLDYQTKAWLEKSLKEYEAYGGIQEKLQRQSQLNAIFGDLSGVISKGVEDSPYPGIEYVKRGQQLGIPMGDIQAPTPEIEGDMTAQYQAVALPLIMARLSNQQPTEEQVSKAIGMFGQDAVYSMIGDFAGDVTKRKEQGLRGREIGVQEQTVPIRRKEAETSAGNLDLESKGGKSLKEIQAEITKLSNERDTQVQKSTGIGSPFGALTSSQGKVVAAKIAKIDMRLRQIEELTGQKILPGQEEYAMFQKMAQENMQRGLEINWEQALILGYDIYWLKELQDSIGAPGQKKK